MRSVAPRRPPAVLRKRRANGEFCRFAGSSEQTQNHSFPHLCLLVLALEAHLKAEATPRLSEMERFYTLVCEWQAAFFMKSVGPTAFICRSLDHICLDWRCWVNLPAFNQWRYITCFLFFYDMKVWVNCPNILHRSQSFGTGDSDWGGSVDRCAKRSPGWAQTCQRLEWIFNVLTWSENIKKRWCNYTCDHNLWFTICD